MSGAGVTITTMGPAFGLGATDVLKIMWDGASIDIGITDADVTVRPSYDTQGGPPGARGYAYAELRRRLGSRVQMVGQHIEGQGYGGNASTAVTGATPDRVQLSEPRTAAVAGKTIAQAASAVAAEIAACSTPPNIIVYGGGVGATDRTGAQMLGDITTYITNARAVLPSVIIIVIAAPQDPSDATKQANRNNYNDGLQATLDALGGRAAGIFLANPYMSSADDRNAFHGAFDGAFDIHLSYRGHQQRAAAVVEIISSLYTVPAGRRYPIARAGHPAHPEPTVLGATDALLWLNPTEWTSFFVSQGVTSWSGGAYVAFDITPWQCPTSIAAARGIFATGGHYSTGIGVSCVGEGTGGTYRRIVAYTSGGVSVEATGVGMLTDGRKMRLYVFWHPNTDPSFGGSRAISIWGSTSNGVELFGIWTGVSAWAIQKNPAADTSWTKLAFGAHTVQDALPASYGNIAFAMGSIPSFDTAGKDCTGTAQPTWIDPVTGEGMRLVDFVEREFGSNLPIPGTMVAMWPCTEGTGTSIGEGSAGTALALDTMSDNQGSYPYSAVSSPVWREGASMPGQWAPPPPLTGTITTDTTVTDTSIVPGDVFVLARTVNGGTVGGAPRQVVTAGQVVFTYQASDTSTYVYTRVRPDAGGPKP